MQDKNSPELWYSENGFVETTFFRGDYSAYNTCPPTTYFLSESVPIDILERLKSDLDRIMISPF
jgi:hypothetical protein